MIKTLIVVDDDAISLSQALPSTITFDDYLREYPKRDEPRTRIVSLCDSARYLSKGYYCSLLAEARQHAAIPSVKTLNELRSKEGIKSGVLLAAHEFSQLKIGEQEQSHIIYLGKVQDARLQKLANKLFQTYPAPLLKMVLKPIEKRTLLSLEPLSYRDLDAEQKRIFAEALSEYTQSEWRKKGSGKRFRWDMAILVNPEEVTPPSNKGALSRFIRAARKLGIRAHTVSNDEIHNLSHYDALFLRETTAIDHYTYRLACKAEAAGLVVLDDPNSILRCCNKVFLHDAFNYQHVPSLNTRIINDRSDETLAQLEQKFSYPMVLKMPEGSFSRGVFKVKTRAELEEKLILLFKESDLVLVQEYLYTDYDWRIGVLNHRAIYACRYHMARDHWQIYNHGSKRFFSGGFETLPTFEVPRSVLAAALKASKSIGNGLYGVDIKCVDNNAYVLEVNDNPNIDHKVEDAYLGEELYMQIMSEFLRRLELRGRQ